MVCGKEAQYSEIIATSANQIVPPVQKRLLYSPDHLSFLEEEEVETNVMRSPFVLLCKAGNMSGITCVVQ